MEESELGTKLSRQGESLSSGPAKAAFMGHPRGLYYLFFAELWERFSFYGMRSLLTLYMVKEVFHAIEQADIKAATVYASYGSLVYAAPVLGGRLADSLLGYRRSILLGGVLMTLGHFVLAIQHPALFYIALAFLIVGNGFFKPNISTFVGKLYLEGDPRKDSGFSIFYMGINIGAALSPLLCGYLAYEFGWHYGFGLAGIGMLGGLIFFHVGIRRGVFASEGLPPDKAMLEERVWGLSRGAWTVVLSFLTVPLIAFAMYYHKPLLESTGTIWDGISLVQLVFILLGILVLIYLLHFCIFKSSHVERSKLVSAMVLTILMTIFWGFFEMQGSSLTLFAERNVNLSFLNASQTNSINPIFIILLAIPVALLWKFLSRKRMNPPTPYKFSFGFLTMGLAFLILSWSGSMADEAGRVPFFYLWFPYLLLSTGELCMSPIGLSKITDLSPRRLAAFMMGVWFLSSSYAFLVVGAVGRYMAVEDTGLEEGMKSLEIYTAGFEKIAYICLATTLVVLLFSPFIRKAMRGVH
ncbi:MAG: oligopeptide:H+ symporter [Cytophagales bacterium]|nr:oligopeptide:H+ symporter [Cytophagales bacterium]